MSCSEKRQTRIHPLLATLFLCIVWSIHVSALAAPAVLVSEFANRSAPIALSGAELQGTRYIFVGPDTGVKRVDFYLDNPPPSTTHSIERVKPFDFNGTEANLTAKPFDTASIQDGQHSVYATIHYDNGSTELLSTILQSITQHRFSSLVRPRLLSHYRKGAPAQTQNP